MDGGLQAKWGMAALLAAATLAWGATSATAADLGGDCCADLEERVAELEATTARKGNRKVSLEVSGHVNEGVIWWDDGHESNAYQVTNDSARTRFRFKGKAKIDADWSAGYILEIGIRTANSKRFNQHSDSGSDNPADIGLDLRDAVWFVQSKTFGTGWVGTTATSTDAITEINQTQTKDFAKYSDVEDTGLGLILRSAVNGELTNNSVGASGQTGLTWRRLIGDGGDQPGEGERRFNIVKYDSPTWHGFTASGSWGQDDFWDVALRYTGELHNLKIAAGIGYGDITSGDQTKTVCNAAINGNQDCNQFGGSVSVLHESTGLFVQAGAGTKHDDLIEDTVRFAGTGVDADQNFWSVQSGIERKFMEHGKTTIYGEYYDYEGGGNSRRTVAAGDALDTVGGSAAIWSTGVQMWGVGLAQGFDKAALVTYLFYRHYEGELELRELAGGVASGTIANSPLEDIDIVFGGGIIRF